MLLTTIRARRANVMPMSWHLMMEFTPPLVGCVVSNGDYSFATLKTTKECVINIPTVELAKIVVMCGNTSGSSVDKFKKFGLTPMAAKLVKAPLIAKCYASLECKVVDVKLVGVKLNWSPLALLNVLVIRILAATLFSTFSLVIACIVKTRERFMGVGQVLTMPLFFASNAIYPTDIMPGWLKVVSHLNPLTYVVDGLRTCMLAGSTSTFGLGFDYVVILLTTTILVCIGARLYPRLAT